MSYDSVKVNELKAGDIIYSVYHYSDAYMPSFYEVISTTPKTVLVRALERSIVPPPSMYDDGSASPIPGKYSYESPIRIKASPDGTINTPKGKWYYMGFYKYEGTPVRYHYMTD